MSDAISRLNAALEGRYRIAFLLVVVTGGGCAHANDRVHEFALFGDSPYRPESVPRVEALIDDVNRRDGLEWVIHVGDTKGGEQPCALPICPS